MDFESLFTQICHDIGKNGDVKEISTRFSTCSTNAQRISFVLALDPVRNCLQGPLSLAKQKISTPCKSHELSISHRVEGNNHYQKKLIWKAICSYNRRVIPPTFEFFCRWKNLICFIFLSRILHVMKNQSTKGFFFMLNGTSVIKC